MVKYRTPAEEILLSVQQWYFSKGFKVPADELKVCKDDIATERRENEYNSAVMMRRRLEYEFECVKEEARLSKNELPHEKAASFITEIATYKKIIESSGIVEKPVQAPKASYGSPEFWKDYWAKKKASQTLNASQTSHASLASKVQKVQKVPKLQKKNVKALV
jgi:hypothetical protein